jgi:N-acetyl sugar amidotransferase
MNKKTPKKPTEHKICSKCIMDTSDCGIQFDVNGECDYCKNFSKQIRPVWQNKASDEAALANLAETIRRNSSRSEFDCIIGLSGGLDSSYAAHIAVKKMGLRPLLVHIDAGWNNDQAVGNIEKLVDGLGLDLYTEVVNWECIKRMQLAFLRSGLPDQDAVQDIAFFSSLYKFSKNQKIKHIITGSNFSTECCREPLAWGAYIGIDRLLIQDIWKKHGDGKPNEEFPVLDILEYKIIYKLIYGIKVYHPLNLVRFIKNEAEDELKTTYGWKRFQHKHHESRFTRFYEDYWLRSRFGYDKRRAHFSSLIMTGQMSRSDALDRISRPEMDELTTKHEFEYVAHKLGISVGDLRDLFAIPKKTYRDFKNKKKVIDIGAKIMQLLGMEKRFFR